MIWSSYESFYAPFCEFTSIFAHLLTNGTDGSYGCGLLGTLRPELWINILMGSAVAMLSTVTVCVVLPLSEREAGPRERTRPWTYKSNKETSKWVKPELLCHDFFLWKQQHVSHFDNLKKEHTLVLTFFFFFYPLQFSFNRENMRLGIQGQDQTSDSRKDSDKSGVSLTTFFPLLLNFYRICAFFVLKLLCFLLLNLHELKGGSNLSNQMRSTQLGLWTNIVQPQRFKAGLVSLEAKVNAVGCGWDF